MIDRKRGLPLTLSIVFLHLASRVGLNASGVGLPGHYLVKVQFDLNEVYVDPFQRGATLTVNEIGTLLSRITGGRGRLGSENLRGWDGRETLLRLLANLQNMWLRAGDERKAASALERLEMLQQ